MLEAPGTLQGRESGLSQPGKGKRMINGQEKHQIMGAPELVLRLGNTGSARHSLALDVVRPHRQAITGQAQSFDSVSSSSWQPDVRAPGSRASGRHQRRSDSSGLVCTTRPPHTPPV